jgi:hypothetical protein
MKKLILILASLMLVGCAKQSALNAFNNEPNNKAIVTTIDGGWGHSVGQISQELAIVGAFYECETRNLLYFCELEKINNDTVSSVEEKNKWKNFYKNEKNKYIFLDGNVSYRDPSKNQLIKQKETQAKKEIEKTPAEQNKIKGFHCLSPWDGSYRPLVSTIKKYLKDPDSFKHRETTITPNNGGIHVVMMTYGAKNSYGGYVVEKAAARLDSNCNLLEVMDQNLKILK